MSVQATKQNSSSRIFDYLAILIVIIGIGLFYSLSINIWFRWAIVLFSIAGGLATFFLVSPTGLHLHDYIRESWRELGKVVWPTRKEAIQFTWIVFAFVLILALFLWLIDSGLSWLLYNVILGRGN